MTNEKWLRPGPAAKFVGVSRCWLYRLMSRGEVPFVPLPGGGRVLFTDDLVALRQAKAGGSR
jgi:predicted DNA-binding transcriptional regulator AlpA